MNLIEQLKNLKLINNSKISTQYKRILSKNNNIINILSRHFPFIDQNDWYQLLFCAMHNINQQPTCLHCKTPIKFNFNKKRFANYCRACVQKVPGIRQKYHAKILEKYGVKTPAQNKIIKQKIKNTNLKKYNVSSFTQTHVFKTKKYLTLQQKYQGVTPSEFKIKHVLKYINNKAWLEHQIQQHSIATIANTLNVSHSLIQKRLQKFNIPVIQHFHSSTETEINDFINKQNIQTLQRTKIDNTEIDILIPEYNLAIEVDGIFWHGETNKKHKFYHLNKTLLCKKHNIDLIHITDVEWKTQKHLVQSRIISLLQKNPYTLHARKCVVKKVTQKEKTLFLQNNSLEGNCKSTINYGLYFKNQLVCIMCFCRTKNHFILTRFASKTHYTIRGGIQKLFNHFIKIYNPQFIITESDKKWCNGTIYQKLGFSLKETKQPNCKYFLRNNPNKFITKNIIKHHNKSNIDKYWDCGKDIWIWTPK